MAGSERHGGGELTTFVGRRDELSALRDRMAASRLVTLVGPGGVGKTRLALRAASDAKRAFADGVAFVDLASLSDASRLASQILLALGVRDGSAQETTERLLGHLADRQQLLLLDNCEHLLEPAAELAVTILEAAPGVRIIATSRAALDVVGEHLLVVPPLAVPDPEHVPSAAVLARYDSVALLVDRARAVVPDFAVTAENRVEVAQLCAALDGIPLAIELAAGRLRSLSLTQVVERLNDRFRLLAGGNRTAAPRQQTLRALIDWSHDLCEEREQRLWSRLSVFPGTFDLAAAEAVAGGDGLDRAEVMDVLDHLVSKSIVNVERDTGHVRFRMLSTVREYAAERTTHEERERLLLRHRDVYLGRARAVASTWCGPDQAQQLRELRADYPNFLAALGWSADHPGEARAGANLVAALRYLWIAGGLLSTGRRWLDQMLDAATEPSIERGHALWVAAWVCLMQGDTTAAAGRLTDCATLAERLDDPVLSAQARGWNALIALFDGDPLTAARDYGDAIGQLDRVGDLSGSMTLSFQRVVALAYAGDDAEGTAECDRLLARAEAAEERWHRAYGLWARGVLAWCRGDTVAAADAATAGLEVERDFADAMASALMIELLAWSAGAGGRHARAAELLGAAAAIWRETGTSIDAFGQHMAADSHRCLEAARHALGHTAVEKTMAGVTATRVEDAVAYALGGTPGDRVEDSPLTRREGQIADLIAQGLRNRDIAEALVISPRTVETHVERILGKLGFSSRAQVAVWASSRSVQL